MDTDIIEVLAKVTKLSEEEEAEFNKMINEKFEEHNEE